MCAGLVGFAGYAVYDWGRPAIGEDGMPVVDEYSELPVVKQYLNRTWAALVSYKQSFEEPGRDLLLPNPVTYPYVQAKYTLVFETNGILLHPEWTYQTGWRFKKRPFLDQFLQQCGPPLFETVAFTQDNMLTAATLIDNLDTQGLIMFRLFRDSTRYVDGKRIKDLNYLNRDMSKVIHIDWNRDACSLNPHNCIILDKWLGDKNDSTLVDLAVFLRTIAAQDIEDVREIIAHYSQFDNPLEVFKENQRRLAQEKEKEEERKSTSLVKKAKNKFY
jgi:import inner membrane translocase subunit TIM50